MTSRTQLTALVSAAVLAATGIGLLVTHQAPSTVAPAPAAAIGKPVIKDTGIIAVDAKTGALRTDLGWRRGDRSAPLSVVYCQVGTQVSPTFKRLLLAPRSPIVGKAAYVWTACSKGFHTWDSLETASGGRWPKMASVTPISSISATVVADAGWRDGFTVLQAKALR